MSFVASSIEEFELWDFILGNIYETIDHDERLFLQGRYAMSISTNRFYYLSELCNMCDNNLKVSLSDPLGGAWTKWERFPSFLRLKKVLWNGEDEYYALNAAIDVHRSVLPNEIVIESDYPEYEDNYKASRIIGCILEGKGFSPLYYFSGNKSIHIHVFFDWDCLKKVDSILQDQIRMLFKDSKTRFRKKFMEWLRKRMISCWDTKAKDFDADLVRASHLIRAELSRNKQGFKTFIGYTYKDMSFVPYICNEQNQIYPKLGAVKLSSPKDINELMEDFHSEACIKTKIDRIRRKNQSLSSWFTKPKAGHLRGCVQSLLSDDFISLNDGTKRALFILINELRQSLGDSEAREVINEWNNKLSTPLRREDIDYRFKTKIYKLKCSYIHSFLEQLCSGFDKKCSGKL